MPNISLKKYQKILKLSIIPSLIIYLVLLYFMAKYLPFHWGYKILIGYILLNIPLFLIIFLEIILSKNKNN